MDTRAAGDPDPPGAPPPAVEGRRERKKLQTREALRAAARELFARKGFTHTTVQQIADAADVSERTFFRYFDAKEDLLLPDLVAVFDAVGAALQRRPPSEPPLLAVLRAAQDAAGAGALGGGLLTLAPGIDASSPVSTAAW